MKVKMLPFYYTYEPADRHNWQTAYGPPP